MLDLISRRKPLTASNLLTLLMTMILANPAADAQTDAPMTHVQVVADYRTFGKVHVVRKEKPVDADTESWRVLYALTEAELRDAAFREHDSLQDWQLWDVENRSATPSLELTFVSMRGLGESILRIEHPLLQEELLEALEARFSVAYDGAEREIPAFQALWEEKILLPEGMCLLNPPADLETVLGVVQLSRNLVRTPGQVLIQTRVILPKSAGRAEQIATLTALEDPPKQLALTIEADILGAMGTDTFVAALAELEQAAQDPQRRNWALIRRAAAFQEAGLPMLASALLEQALSVTPDSADLMRAQLMTRGYQAYDAEGSRMRSIARIEALLAQQPLDAKQLKLALARCLAKAEPNQQPPSTQDLQRAAALWVASEPQIWQEEGLKILVHQAGFAELERILGDPEVWIPWRPAFRLMAAAGLQSHGELARRVRELESAQAKEMVNQAYEVLLQGNQFQALQLLAKHATGYLSEEQRHNIEHGSTEAARVLGDQDPQDIYKQWLKAISQRAGEALERLVYPASLNSDRIHFQHAYHRALYQAGPKWPLAIEEGRLVGDASYGYRLELPKQTIYFASAADHYRMVAVGEAGYLLSAYALELIARHQPEGAFQWLDWAYGAPKDQIAMVNMKHNALFWTKETPRTAEMAALAARVLMAMGTSPQRALLALKETYPSLTGKCKDQLGILLLHHASELGEGIKTMDFTASGEDLALAQSLNALRCAIQGNCAEQVSINASDPLAQLFSHMTSTQPGNYAAALEQYQAAAKAGHLKEIHSYALLNSALRERDVPQIPEAFIPADGSDPYWLIYRAERGQIWEVLSVLAGGASSLPHNQEYYLSGHLAEALGEPEVAATMYRAIQPALPLFRYLELTCDLAQKRLNLLAAATKR